MDENTAIAPNSHTTNPEQADIAPTESEQLETAAQTFPIVGIGASAGGLQAIEEFFDHMPVDSGAAFIVVQHLSPDFKSLMNELLERRTQMNVRVATEGMSLEKDTIFLIPPGQNMRIRANCLHLTSQERSGHHQPHYPINLFFQSAAAEGKDRVISIVLSGTGTDGTKGIQSVSAAGGLVLVQDPITAEFDGMPRSAIATELADLILPPHALATTTYQFATAPDQRKAFKAHQETQIDSAQLQQIIGILESYEQIDFSQYKPNTLIRRIDRRCMIAGHGDLNSYIQELQRSPEARSTLRNDLLITVTRFFRDRDAWDFLEAEILPELIARAAPERPIRVWITACATGEEAYSIAMLLRELLEQAGNPAEAKIFATDIDQVSLAKASAGIYPAETLADLSAARRDRFFNQKGSEFEVSRSLRETIIFANHNLTKDAAFTHMDLVSCRNVLIYMQPELQQQVLRNLHFSLKPDSILFLGESENLGQLEKEFKERLRKWNIYQKIRDVRLPIKAQNLKALSVSQLKVQASAQPKSVPRFDPLIESAFTALLKNKQATCFLVDRNNQLIHLCGDELNLLKVSAGRASQDIIRMLPESLQFPLHTALYRARQKETQVTYKGCRVDEVEVEVDTVAIEVSAQNSLSAGNYSMVTIEKERELIGGDLGEKFSSDQATAQYILQLQQELQAARESLQSTVEELETTNEEQQSTNEELIASNEELQSTNEELHSVNEELHTVNSEYQAKIQALVQLNNDIDNLLNSIDIGVIFLDIDLNIRQFTPAATQAFNLLAADIGRPLEQLSHNLENFETSEILMQAQVASPVEHKIKVKGQGPYMLLQIYPYLSDDKVRDGLVLTLVNIDDIQQSQKMLAAAQADLRQANEALEEQVRDRTQALRSSEQMLKSITQTTPNAIYIYDLVEQRNIYANAFLERLLGFDAETLQEKGDRLLPELIHPDDLTAIVAHHQTITESDADDSHVFPLEYRIQNVQGEWRYFYTQDIIFERSSTNQPIRILGTAVDISDQKIAALQLQKSENRYRTLYQSTPVMMHSVNRDGQLINVSNRWLSVLGYEESEVIGQPVSDFLQDNLDCEEGCEQVGSKLEADSWMNPQGCEDLPCQLVSKNGQQMDVLLSAVAQQDDTGKLNRLLAVIVDVTERTQAEAELNNYREHLEELVADRADEIEQTNQRLRAEIKERQQTQSELAKHALSLERSNDSLEEFAYVVSHDLQEPLRAMTVFSQLLEQRHKNDLDATARDYLDNIVQGGTRMQAMIDGILDFSRVSHSNQHLQPVSLQSILDSLRITLQPLLEANQAALTYAEMPTVMADPNQITQVFQNLISNAIKFKSDAPPDISVTAEIVDIAPGQVEFEPARRWRIGVKDNGIGIPPDQQSRIFTLFQRLHTRQEREGYGIGLSICKKIIERHHGRIRVVSEVGEGATFYFTLEAWK